jgi:putative FmdB family regulatory protein
MPLYDYRCQKCGETFEVIQKFSDDPLTVHEGCGGQVERQVSAPSFQFKGTGWYVTDYGKNGKVPAKHSNGSSESKKETSDSKPKTESKPSTPAKSE